jgi:TonB family protein
VGGTVAPIVAEQSVEIEGIDTGKRLAYDRRMRRFLLFAASLTLATVAGARAADYQPAHRVSGDIPQPPVNAIGWVEAVIDVEVDASGAIVKTTGLRATPGGLDFVLPSLRNWKFQPANDGKSSVPSHVLVAALMRPAQLFDPAGGSPAADVAKAGDEVPYPKSMARPSYPGNAVGDRSVLVEVLLGSDGRVEDATIVGAASGFDSSALAAARAWTFRPAKYNDQAVPGAAYLIFGFRTPVG